MEFDVVKEVIRNALVPNKNTEWVLDIKVDLNDAHYAHEKNKFSDDEFMEIGLGVAILANRLINYRHLEENEWLERGLCDYLPYYDDYVCAHTIVDVNVTRGGMILNIDNIDDEIAREIVKDYYFENIIPDYEDEECDIDEILNDIFTRKERRK